jgi:uncharacterized protein (DUF2236 family)
MSLKRCMDFPLTKVPSPVSPQDMEALLVSVAKSTANPKAGVFGPNSISWKVDRESALFLAGGRAALLQIAHPWVAAALAQHSRVLANPIARFHNTFRVVFAMVFGSLDQALAASRHLHALHSRIRGEMPEEVGAWQRGSRYEANEIAALRWVWATLTESAALAYESVLPLSPAEREQYYAESKITAALYGIPPAALPEDWTAFTVYNQQMWQSQELGVSEFSRSMAHNLLCGAGSWIHVPRWFRALTAAWMPPRFRAEFALDFSPRDQRAAERALRWLPVAYRGLPPAVRFVGPYHEACARLSGRTPGVLTRYSNRFWTGQPQLPLQTGVSRSTHPERVTP